MTKPEPLRYRSTNWNSCNAALKLRGSLLAWRAPKAGKSGRPPVFSE